MLFAKFPDAETEEATQDLFNRLVPEGIAFFKRASYGEMTLTVDAHHRWVPMDEASTTGRYDCSKWDTHKTYIAEVMRKTARDVDFKMRRPLLHGLTPLRECYQQPTVAAQFGVTVSTLRPARRSSRAANRSSTPLISLITSNRLLLIKWMKKNTAPKMSHMTALTAIQVPSILWNIKTPLPVIKAVVSRTI
jgi:hypothetical protein